MWEAGQMESVRLPVRGAKKERYMALSGQAASSGNAVAGQSVCSIWSGQLSHFATHWDDRRL
jgi:hypothetical protein